MFMKRKPYKRPGYIHVAGRWIKTGSEAHPAIMPSGYSPEYMKDLIRYIGSHKPFPVFKTTELENECFYCGQKKGN